MLKKVLRSLSTFLVLVMLINMLPRTAWSAANTQNALLELSANDSVATGKVFSESSTTDIPTAKIIREAVDRRTEYSKAFQLDNGTYVAAVYAQPIHYEVNGQWEDIDNTLQINTDGTFSNKAGMWNVQLPQQLSGSDAVTVVKNGYTLSFRMAGELLQPGNLEIMNISQAEPLTASVETFSIASQIYSVSAAQTVQGQIQAIDISAAYNEAQYKEFVAEKNASRLLYANVYEGTDVQYDLKGNQLKESIILDAYRNTLRGYRYVLNVGEMIPVIQEDNSIYFYDSDRENVVMVMPAPYLVDDAGVYNYDVQVNLTGTGSTYTLTYLLPQQWLAQESRAWPVILDPVITPQIDYLNIRDHTVASNGSYARDRYVLECGYGPSSHIHRIYLKYRDLPTLPDDAVIASANIKMYKLDNTSNSSGSMQVHKVLANWETETLTWANKPGYNAVVEDSVVIGNGSGYYTWDVTNIVQGWYANTNTGMMFKMDTTTEEAGGSSWKQFYSCECGVTDYMPTLTMEYLTETNLHLGYSATVNITEAEGKQIFKFTPTVTGTYILQSSNPTGDPKVWLYDSNFTNIWSNDDSGENRNFRLSVYLYANQPYHIVAGHYGTNTGSYYLTVLKPANVSNKFYKLWNVGSGQKLDVHGPDEEIYVHQWTDHTGEQQKWLIQRQEGDGYYTIRSQYGSHKYVGIENANTGENNVRLFSSIDDRTLWNFYITLDGKYILEPKTALGKALYAPDNLEGTEMRLVWMGTGGDYNKWLLNEHTYSGLTFSAFDMSDSDDDEVDLVRSYLQSYGYTDIGSYKNTDGFVPAQLAKDLGRLSDIVYICGHGGLYSNLYVKDSNGAIVEYICADESVDVNDGKDKIGIGAHFKSGSTTITDSYWNAGTKWVILENCDQLDYIGDRGSAHWDGLYSAQVWARTMLGDGERIHGFLGYYNSAPGGTTAYAIMNNFLLYAEQMSIIDAWKLVHPSGWLVPDTNWAVMYHQANANDWLNSFTASTTSGSPYTIYLERHERDNASLVVRSDTSEKNLVINENTYFQFSKADINKTNRIYRNLQNVLLHENAELKIDEYDRIVYNNFNKHTGEANLGLALSDQQAVSTALQYLDILGLAPDGDYKASVSYVRRYEMDVSNNPVSAPETIQYNVCFNRTVNGIDLLSDQGDGIIVSFDKYGITNLQYKWRDVQTVTVAKNAHSDVITSEQAKNIYLAAVEETVQETLGADSIESTQKPIVTLAYAEIDGQIRPVWACSPNGAYGNHIFIDVQTGQQITFE